MCNSICVTLTLATPPPRPPFPPKHNLKKLDSYCANLAKLVYPGQQVQKRKPGEVGHSRGWRIQLVTAVCTS